MGTRLVSLRRILPAVLFRKSTFNRDDTPRKIFSIMGTKKSFKSKAINAVITAIIRTIFGWVEEWGEDAFFFLVIGDKTCTDVAFYNTENLSCEGALAVTSNVETAGAFFNLAGSADILLEEPFKEDDFRKEFENTSPGKDKQGWFSVDNNEEEGGAL